MGAKRPNPRRATKRAPDAAGVDSAPSDRAANRNWPEQRSLTFSQAQGFEGLPSPLEIGVVNEHARTDLWNWLWMWVQDPLSADGISDEAGEVLRAVYLHLLHQPLDAFPSGLGQLQLMVKPWFTSAPFNKLFDIIQFMLRTPKGHQHFPDVRQIFRRNLLAYDIIDIPPDGPTIVPNASPEEGEAIRTAFADLATGPFDGARHHLQQATAFINAGDAAKAVAQAMHAVESVVRVISPNSNFSQALAALNAKSAMHPALSKALGSLYGYTSDEKGIRHPLLESDVSKVHMHEAVFMYGACAAFITYLIARARDGGLLNR